MKVLIATKETQGRRKSDFSHTTDGELVTFGFECDRDRNNIDGGCGCRRTMVGIKSGRGTTTFMVSELDITRDELIKRLSASHILTFGDSLGEEGALEMAEEDADELTIS